MKRFETKTHDEIVGHIYKTRDYSKFSFSTTNREVNTRRASKLAEELKSSKAPLLEPIQVTKQLQILDGQHRFYALREANKPIYYYVDNNAAINDASELNSDQKNWTLTDYVKSFKNQGYQDYFALWYELKKYKDDASIMLIINVFASTPKNTRLGDTRVTVDHLKHGKYEFDYEGQRSKESFFNFLARQNKKIGQKIPTNLQKALSIWFYNDQVNKKRLSKIINKKFLEDNEYSKVLAFADAIGQAYNKQLKARRVDYYIVSHKVFHFVDDKGRSK